MPAQPAAHQWQFDPAAGPEDFFGPNGYELSVPLWDIDWVPFDSGFHVSYRTAPFNEAQVISGPGYLRAWVRSSVDEAHVQVTLSEIAPDDTQTLIQSGWLNIGHRRSSIDDKQRVRRTFSREDYEDIPINEWVEVLVAIPSFAHAMRAGSHLQITISTPSGPWNMGPLSRRFTTESPFSIFISAVRRRASSRSLDCPTSISLSRHRRVLRCGDSRAELQSKFRIEKCRSTSVVHSVRQANPSSWRSIDRLKSLLPTEASLQISSTHKDNLACPIWICNSSGFMRTHP